MKKTRVFLVLISLGFSLDAFALMELSGRFSYDKTVYGASRENKITNRTWAGGLAIYLFNNTALELNYSTSEENTVENEVIPLTGYNVSVVGTQTTIENEVYGVGLKQVLGNRKGRIVPSISLGYAKQFITSVSDATYRDDTTLAELTTTSDPTKTRVDSVFGTFTLKLNLTSRLSLTGSVNTLFKAFETDKARDNLKYSVGFSWIL
ncbi:MAG: hypothetical protein KC493_10345 [Bacteriovoracaceae bacterium]|nr:hypothetical protein [Bacteriovoracaceae bacterium]